MDKIIGVLVNPKSGRIKGGTDRIRKILKSLDNIIYRELDDFINLESVLNEFNESNVNILIVVSGDGTVHALLTSLFNNQTFRNQPLLGLIPAGTTNMTMKEFGISGSPEKVLQKLIVTLKNDSPLKTLTRPVLCVDNGGSKKLYGMFFGAGLIADGVKYFNDRIKSSGITGERASGFVMFKYIFNLLVGRSSDSVRSLSIEVNLDNNIRHSAKCLLLLVSSLDRLLLGCRPYWGELDKPMHYTMLSENPKHLWYRFWLILTGKGEKLIESNGYYSENSSSMRLTYGGEFIVDGEIYSSKSNDEEIVLSAKEQICVITGSRYK